MTLFTTSQQPHNNHTKTSTTPIQSLPIRLHLKVSALTGLRAQNITVRLVLSITTNMVDKENQATAKVEAIIVALLLTITQLIAAESPLPKALTSAGMPSVPPVYRCILCAL